MLRFPLREIFVTNITYVWLFSYLSWNGSGWVRIYEVKQKSLTSIFFDTLGEVWNHLHDNDAKEKEVRGGVKGKGV